jgi:16S rRNA (guanine527-N7)-methyltransferase
VDSIGKKIKVVTEVSQALGLKNLIAQHERAEKIKGEFHFIISRAVTEFPEFYNWIYRKVSKDNFNDLSNGILYLKGGDLREEFGKYYDKSVFYPLKDYFEEEFFETKKVVYYKLV